MRYSALLSETDLGVLNNPAFKAWFGSSQIVDAAGAPLVVYHGTDKAFEVFVPQKGERGDGGIFIDTVMSPFKFFAADVNYAHDVAYNKAADGRGVVLKCYLRMQQPIDLSTAPGRIAFNKIFGTFQRHSKVLAIKAKIKTLQDDLETESRFQPRENTYFNLYQDGKLVGSSTRQRTDTPYTYKPVHVSLEQAVTAHAKAMATIRQKISRVEAGIDRVVGTLKQPASIWDALDEPDAADKVKAAGFDGIIFLENSGEKSFAVIDPSQIKSVRNRGSYSDQSPNIHEAVDPDRAVPFVLPPDLADKGDMVASYDPVTQAGHIGSIVSQERGFGRAAVTAFEAWAKAQGAKKVTGEAVWASLSFWMKLGYKDRGRGYASQVPIWKYFW